MFYVLSVLSDIYSTYLCSQALLLARPDIHFSVPSVQCLLHCKTAITGNVVSFSHRYQQRSDLVF